MVERFDGPWRRCPQYWRVVKPRGKNTYAATVDRWAYAVLSLCDIAKSYFVASLRSWIYTYLGWCAWRSTWREREVHGRFWVGPGNGLLGYTIHGNVPSIIEGFFIINEYLEDTVAMAT